MVRATEGDAVLALDFDGVIARNQPESEQPRLSAIQRLVPERVARLNRIVEVTRCRVTISSTWRYSPRVGTGFSAEQLGEWLKQAGFMGKVAGITPAFSDEEDLTAVETHRGREILAWCAAQVPLPRALAVLDDARLRGAVAPFLVRTDPSVGLTDADVERAIVLLRARPRSTPWASGALAPAG
jgi:hypothetical protein